MEEEQQKTKANLYKLTRIIELQPFAGGQVPLLFELSTQL